MTDIAISFGDTVRVRESEVTVKAGLAGLAGRVGPVYGQTTPSVTGVEVIGEPEDDYAINVFFEELDRDHWFPPELLESVDHGAGTTMSLEGISKEWVRTEAGEWEERDTDAPPGSE